MRTAVHPHENIKCFKLQNDRTTECKAVIVIYHLHAAAAVWAIDEVGDYRMMRSRVQRSLGRSWSCRISG